MKIILKGITKKYGSKTVIKPLDLEINNGSFTTLLGPSGCGKTTLLRMISGLETPDSGEIYFDDKLIFSSEKGVNIPPEKRGLGFVFQDFALWPHMSVYENVAFGLRTSGRTSELDKKVMAALKAVKLEDYAKRFPNQLSGDQQQRVAFARAIVIEPQCILFDEPLSALDALLREQMRSELKELVSRLGITAVFVTHDQTEAMSMSDMIAVMSEGAVEQYDAPEKVYSSPASEFAIDNRSMFRPESASDVPVENAVRFDTTVRSVQFLGGAYQIMLDCCGEKWSFLSSKRMSVGNTLPIYINKNNIITV